MKLSPPWLLTAAWLGLSLLAAQPGGSGASPSVPGTRGPAEARQVALVFEVSGTGGALPEVLAALQRLGVQATFFITGRWAEQHPGQASMIAEAGHAIGNGAWSRKDLCRLADWQVQRELLLADDRFGLMFGAQYVPLFRAPSGVVDSRVQAVIEKLGFTVVRCTIDSHDEGGGPVVAANIERRILQHRDEELDGASILLHCDAPQTAAALSTTVRSLRRRGFEFVPLTEWIHPGAPRREPPVLSATEPYAARERGREREPHRDRARDRAVPP